MNETTKRHPRTTVEAFKAAKLAACMYGPYRNDSHQPFADYMINAAARTVMAAVVAAILLAVVGVPW
jgi:hypothetical protein